MDGRAVREQVARYGDRLEKLMALARGTSDAKQSARAKASALRHEILGLDAELARRGAPERTPLQRLLRSVERLLQDLGASSTTSAVDTCSVFTPSDQYASGSREGVSGCSRAEVGGRGDLASLFVHAEHAQAASEEEMLQHLQHLQTDRDLNFAETNATERALELQKLERDVTDIDDLIRDVGVLVQTQGEQMGEGGKGVELDLANTRAVARKAAIETAKAGKSRAKRRSVEGGASAAAVGGVVGIVGGPVGMAAGAAFGAMLGGWVGKKWGKREIEDIDAGLSRLERL